MANKNKIKSFYELTNDLHLWWNGKEWAEPVYGEGSWSKGSWTNRRFLGTDARKAWKIFYASPAGCVLVKLTRNAKNTGYYVDEWERT
jgi:hypothetical protein